jgi:hypothetical protein
MSQYTPGPWDIYRGSDTGSVIAVCEGTERMMVCDFRLCQRSKDENEANARLIAAAPDLLGLAVQVAKEYSDASDWKDAIGKLQKMARSAIAKAEGE